LANHLVWPTSRRRKTEKATRDVRRPCPHDGTLRTMGGTQLLPTTVCDRMKKLLTRRADRAPGRGRAGEASAWRRMLPGRVVLFCPLRLLLFPGTASRGRGP